MAAILHIDMDAFFAAVEEKRRPELKGKPVVIGGSGDPTKRGVVSTANYEARKYGIHSAMPLRTAHRLCPHAVFLPVDFDEYARVSRQIKEIFRHFSLVMEDVGIDEAYLDVSDIKKSPEEIASEIKKKIFDDTGLTCSIGIAANKLLAKIASDMQKPDGLTILAEEDVKTRVWPLPARKLHGVGPKTEVVLKAMGIMTIGDLASIPLEKLLERFGKSYGSYLFEASRGIDQSPLVTHWEPKSASRETTFQYDTNDWQTIARTLAEVTKDVVQGMRESGYRGRTITLKIKYHDFQVVSRAKSIPEPTDSEEIIRKTAFECLKRVELKKKVRLIGIRIGGLERKSEDLKSE
ncbi:MAG: DNA polymerase IV [bacterium]